MASLKLSHVYKVYPNGAKAVNDFNLGVEDGEFVVLVGPSGCGKSTTLRMIAGLEEISAGEIFIGDELVNSLEPKDRDIAFVFQNYALYPHMTVYQNMAFGLKNAHMPNEEIEKRVAEAAKMLDLTPYLDRLPKEMSGGQRQRVALGRCLVRNPKVFLLDEPLSNLDAKLRAQMRTEITKLHQKVGTTFIYVTHDQTEAMTMGDRIVVMKDGFVQQIDTPMNLYKYPANKFVAGFIGTPQMNFFDATATKEGDKVVFALSNGMKLEVPYALISTFPPERLREGKKVIVGFRPEHIKIVDSGLRFLVNVVERLGSETLLYGDLQGEESLPIVLKTGMNDSFKPGLELNVAFVPEEIHLFDPDEGETLLKEDPGHYSFEVSIKDEKLELFGQSVSIPKAWKGRYKEGSPYVLSIPTDALTEGQSLKLKVGDCKEFEGKVQAEIIDEGLSYFFLFDKKPSGNFDVLFEKATLSELGQKEIVIEDEEAPAPKAKKKLFFKPKKEIKEIKTKLIDAYLPVIEPLEERLSLAGKILREQSQGSIEFYFQIEGQSYPAIFEVVKKAAAYDGIDCHKKVYSFLFPYGNVSLKKEKEGLELPCSISSIIDYGTNKFFQISIGESKAIIPANEEFALGEEAYLALDFSEMSLIDPTNDIIVA